MSAAARVRVVVFERDGVVRFSCVSGVLSGEGLRRVTVGLGRLLWYVSDLFVYCHPAWR